MNPPQPFDCSMDSSWMHGTFQIVPRPKILAITKICPTNVDERIIPTHWWKFLSPPSQIVPLIRDKPTNDEEKATEKETQEEKNPWGL